MRGPPDSYYCPRDGQRLYTPGQAAKLFRVVNEKTVRRWSERGKTSFDMMLGQHRVEYMQFDAYGRMVNLEAQKGCPFRDGPPYLMSENEVWAVQEFFKLSAAEGITRPSRLRTEKKWALKRKAHQQSMRRTARLKAERRRMEQLAESVAEQAALEQAERDEHAPHRYRIRQPANASTPQVTRPGWSAYIRRAPG